MTETWWIWTKIVFNPGRTWTIEEYASRFKYDPELREVLVEAESDSQFFHHFLSGLPKRVNALASRHVQDDRDLQIQLGFATGAKGKCLTVGHYLAQRATTAGPAVVVDRDHDGLCGAPAQYVFCTDFYSLEMYAYSPEIFDALLHRLWVNAHKVSGSDIIDIVDPALRLVSACRQTLREMTPSVKMWEDWRTRVKMQGGTLSIPMREIISKSLKEDRGAVTSEEIEAVLSVVESCADSADDVRRQARGHDCFHLVLKVLQSRWAKERGIRASQYSREDVEGLGRMALTHEYLLEFPLFRELHDRYEAP